MYRVAYFKAIDLAITTIQDQFDQPGYAKYRNLEDLLLKAAHREEYGDELQQVCALYEELDISSLKVQLTTLATHFASKSHTPTFREILD